MFNFSINYLFYARGKMYGKAISFLLYLLGLWCWHLWKDGSIIMYSSCKYLVHWVIAGSVAKSVHSYVFSKQNKKSKTKSTSLWTQIWEDQLLVGFGRIHWGILFYFPCEPNQGKIIFFISFFFLKFSIHAFTPTKYSVRVFQS